MRSLLAKSHRTRRKSHLLMFSLPLLFGIIFPDSGNTQSPGDFVITEFMANPVEATDARGEYVEIFNRTGMTIDIDGCRVRDNSGATPGTVSGTLEVSKGGLVVFGRSDVPNRDVLIPSSGAVNLNNGGDIIVFECPDGGGGFTTIASVTYTNSIAGQSYELNDVHNQNNGITDFSNYNGSTTILDYDPENPANDLGSPGTAGLTNLPISLVAFSGERVDRAVELQWSTAIEINNDFMAVERSQDGHTFTEIGRVSGQGTTDIPQDYSFLDRQAYAGLTYYRLRQVDFDGTTTYHRVIAVEPAATDTTSGVRLFPTVVNDQLTLRFPTAPNKQLPFAIFNLTGQVVQQGTLEAELPEQRIILRDYPAGPYLISLSLPGGPKTLRFIKR